jgi:DNA-binding Lrp family transcriptional regulator
VVATVRVYVLVETSVGREYEVAEAVSRLASGDLRVTVDVVYGEYDLVVVVETSSLELLDRAITAIRRVPGVLRTKTLISSESR